MSSSTRADRPEERLFAIERARREVAMRDTAEETAPADPRLRDTYRDLGSVLGRIQDPLLRAELERIRRRLVADEETKLDAGPAVALSPREREALSAAAQGLSNAEIGSLMGLSAGTVKAYLRSVMRKLGSRNRIEAVNTARALGHRL